MDAGNKSAGLNSSNGEDFMSTKLLHADVLRILPLPFYVRKSLSQMTADWVYPLESNPNAVWMGINAHELCDLAGIDPATRVIYQAWFDRQKIVPLPKASPVPSHKVKYSPQLSPIGKNLQDSDHCNTTRPTSEDSTGFKQKR